MEITIFRLVELTMPQSVELNRNRQVVDRTTPVWQKKGKNS